MPQLQVAALPGCSCLGHSDVREEFGKDSNTSCRCQSHSKSIPALPGTHIIPFPELHGTLPVDHSLCKALGKALQLQPVLTAVSWFAPGIPSPETSPCPSTAIPLPGQAWEGIPAWDFHCLSYSRFPGSSFLPLLCADEQSVSICNKKLTKVLFHVAKCSLTPLSDPVSQAQSLKIHPSVTL